MRCTPGMEINSKDPLVNAQVLKENILYVIIHVLVSHAKLYKHVNN